ncbi:MAG: restriction endonuclease [Ignavibacteriales bacterium]
MSRGKKTTVFEDIVDTFYSASIILSIFVWGKTANIWLGALTFLGSLGLLYLAISKYKKNKRKKLFESGIDEIDNMRGEVFEDYLLEHFKNLGYSGHLTPKTDDYGADLVLKKAGRKVVVQAKRWKMNVGVDAIQQVIGAIKYYDANKGMVVTNSSFTENAYDLANSNGIELWDRKKLIEIMSKSKGKEIVENVVKEKRSKGEEVQNDEVCPKCGRALSMKKGKFGKFLGCSGYPACKFTRNI